MNFIKLTQMSGNSCYIDKYSIKAIVEVDIPPTTPYTIVHFAEGKTIGVKETLEEVRNMIKEEIEADYYNPPTK